MCQYVNLCIIFQVRNLLGRAVLAVNTQHSDHVVAVAGVICLDKFERFADTELKHRFVRVSQAEMRLIAQHADESILQQNFQIVEWSLVLCQHYF